MDRPSDVAGVPLPIVTLRVAGYRSVRQVRLALGPVTVLVGPKGCGKTNLCLAL